MKTSLAVAAAALTLSGAALAASTVTPGEVAQRIHDPQRAPLLLDVRTAREFAEGHVPGAVNIPVQDLAAQLGQVPQDREIVVYCEVGGRASRAGKLLRENGYARVSEMEGSMSAWRKAGLPVAK